MRWIYLSCLLGACADPGRERVAMTLELRAETAGVEWDEGTAVMDRAQVHVGHLLLREALDLSGSQTPFDDRRSDPVEVGRVGAAWAEARDVDLLGTTGGNLAIVDGYEGTYAWASFWVGPAPRDVLDELSGGTTLEISGLTTLSSGRVLAFDVTLRDALEVVKVPVDVAWVVGRPSARLLWTLDLGELLGHVPWTTLDDETVTEASPGVATALLFGLGSPDTWSMEVR